MKRVAYLECVYSISSLGLNCSLDLLGVHSVLIHAVIEHNALDKVHSCSGDEPVSLGHDIGNHGVLVREGSERAGADFLFTVGKEYGLVDDSEHILTKLGAFECDCLSILEGLFLLVGDILSDGHR